MIVDSTVQHKAIAHPTDRGLLETARVKLLEAAKDAGVALKQTFAKEAEELGRKVGRNAHDQHFKRTRRAIKRQHTIFGRLQREVDRKASAIRAAVREALGETLDKAARIVAQSGKRKAAGGQPKLYARQAPEVDCISKGKARTPYEFGVKVGIASTLKGNLIVSSPAFYGSPYHGHTHHEQLKQPSILMQESAARPTTAFVDLGYGGVDADDPDVHIVHRGKSQLIREQESKQLRRPQAIEPIIGHLRPITEWTAATSRAKPVTGCTRCCALRATTSDGCCT